MTINHLDFEDIPYFSKTDLAYIKEVDELKPFYEFPVAIESFDELIQRRKENPIDRKKLSTAVQEQYMKLGLHDKHSERLLLNETFTVVTAHQPSLFTGPLYYIYKIASTIHLSSLLNQRYPDLDIIPVFVTGGEDHDFEEMNHLNLFGRSVVWQNDEKGSVGRMSSASLTTTKDDLFRILGDSDHAITLKNLINSCLNSTETYGQFMQKLTMELFHQTDLLVINMDNSTLKGMMVDIFKDDLLNHSSKSLVEPTQKRIEAAGYKIQAFCRQCNVYYLGEGNRERIEKQEDDSYLGLESQRKWTKEQLVNELEQFPERFSPNVIMRPLYQEKVLPNLAYIGGGGEIAYWLERLEQFNHYNIPFPMLIRRNSVLWVDSGTKKQLGKLGLEVKDMFLSYDEIVHHWLTENTDEEVSYSDEITGISDSYDKLIEKARLIDPTVAKAIAAEKVKQLKSFSHLGKRIVRAQKQKNESSLSKINKLKEKLFPGNGLQERHDNFMQYYIKHGQKYFDFLIDQLNPLEKKFIVIEEAL